MILDKFPKVLWINLEQSVDRRKYMEELLEKYKLENIRIPAVLGELMNPEFRNTCVQNKKFFPKENACTCSHLKALKYFIENMVDEHVIIFEDDISFEFLQYITYNWSDLINKIPSDYNVIQLASSAADISLELTPISAASNSFGTIAYLITRKAAIQLLEKYYSKKLKRLILTNQEWVTADSAIYSLPNTYRIPIFTYTNNDSTIHNLHLTQHLLSKKQQLEKWQAHVKIDEKL